MTMAPAGTKPALTRRRFGQWGLAATAAGIAGCGGGGNGNDGNGDGVGNGGNGGGGQPPVAAGHVVQAGALGGSGYAVWQGEITRLPDSISGLAFNRQGDVHFVGEYPGDTRLGRKPRSGASTLTPLASGPVSGHLFDALDRYLVTLQVPTDLGRQVAYVQGGELVVLAGGAPSASLKDGRGAAASIGVFGRPLLRRGWAGVLRRSGARHQQSLFADPQH
jgi:hypothetical protein